MTSRHFSVLVRSLCVALISFGIILFCAYQASALTDEQWTYFNLNGIRMYNPEGNSCVSGSAAANVAGSTAAEKVWNGLRSVGFTAEEAAAMMGNMEHESSFNPFEQNTDPKHATGIMQWLWNGRFKNLLKQLEDAGYGSYFGIPSKYSGVSYDEIVSEIGEETYDGILAIQIAYAKKEIDGNKDYRKFKSAGTVEQMALSFCMNNEGPGEAICATTKRDERALKYYNLYKDLPVSGGGVGGSTASADGTSVTIIGDSLTVGLSTKPTENHIEGVELVDGLPKAYVDATVGRSWSEGLTVLETLKAGNNLGNTAIFALGTNNLGSVDEEDLEDVYNIVGSSRKLFFVTNYTNKVDYSRANKIMKDFADSHANVHIIDYASVIGADPDKLIGGDDIHNTAEGQKKFRDLLINAVGSAATGSSSLDICNNYGGGAWTVGDLPWYRQCDDRWGGLMYGSGGINGSSGNTICNSGCGPASLAMLITAILGQEILPSETADIAGKAGMHVSVGSSWEITKTLADHYGLNYKVFDTDKAHCKETVNNALMDGWMIHTSGTGSKPFSANGHMIGIAGLTTDGKWVIANSARYDNKNGEYDPDAVINAGMNCNNLKGIRR